MMSPNLPIISVVIPTHNRQTSLKRLLDALQTQSYSPELLEVIVVADGCKDGTIEMLQEYEAPFTLRFIEQPGQGAATARNQGATHATGTLLLFLDDDIEPLPYLVEAHVYRHLRQQNQVVIGYLPPTLQNQSSFYHMSWWAWWEDKFQLMREPGHRYTYNDLLSGNFSLPVELFDRVGGFDSTLRCCEDYELGARLIKADAQFTFAADALGHHRDEVTDLNRSLGRKQQEARADIQFGRSHPDLIYNLRVSSFGEPPLLDWILVNLVFWMPLISDYIAKGLQLWLNLLEQLHLYVSWQGLNQRLHGYWYLRGIVDELKTYRSLLSFLQGGIIHSSRRSDTIELDLQQGLIVAEQQLDEKRPKSAYIRYGSHSIGHIPSQAGAEPLRGVHLRPFLIDHLPSSLLATLMHHRLDESTETIEFTSPKPVPEYTLVQPLIELAEEIHAY